jgi:UTP-glucose-1-phosphate uridylyltransferase
LWCRACRTKYLTLFGQYIIKPQIFDFLETTSRNVRRRGEFG